MENFMSLYSTKIEQTSGIFFVRKHFCINFLANTKLLSIQSFTCCCHYWQIVLQLTYLMFPQIFLKKVTACFNITLALGEHLGPQGQGLWFSPCM